MKTNEIISHQRDRIDMAAVKFKILKLGFVKYVNS